MSSFAELRTSRKGKESKSYVAPKIASGASPEPLSLPSNDQDLAPRLYSCLPTTIEIRETEEAGRGLWAKFPVYPGTTILSCKPHTVVPSNQHLNAYCSACLGPSTSQKLQRCTLCRTVWYCGSECQQRDWGLHKLECKALREWAVAAPSEDVSIPSDAIRCLGRLLWKRQKIGPTKSWTMEIDAMISHRSSSMPPSAIESHTHLAHSLVRYLGVSSPEGLSPFGITSAGDLVDILSRFTTNAFNVSSPSLEPIGVCVSPPVALINHSCDPNAVIVFPRVSDSPDKEPQMQIIAIRPISAGEEVLTAYIDTRVPKSMRQAALQQTYNFTCKCKLCSIDGVDPRAAMWCPKSCGGICPLPISDSDIVRCNKCNAVVKSTEAVIDAVRVSQEGLDKATALEVKDPEKSQQLVNNLIPILVSAGLTPSSHPLLAMSHLQQTLLITSFNESFNSELTTSENERKAAQDVLDNAIRAANRHVTGLASVLPEGHPIRAIALAELGKLLVVDEPAPKRADNQNGHPLPQSYGVVPSYPPSGPPRLKLAYDTLLQAHKELLIGFGKTNEGGLVGKEIRQTLTAIEKELGVWKQGIRNVIEDQPRPSK